MGRRAFYLESGVWVDSALDASRPRVRVEAFSARYFELLRAEPELQSCFALGPRVVVQLGDKVYEVTPPRAP